MRALGERTIFASMLATAIAALAVLLIARVTGADAVGRAFDHVAVPWVALVAGAELATYPAYIVAYRSIARLEGHPRIALPMVARIVVAGFGPFALSGGFGIDKQALHALHEDEDSAHRRVVALGTIEWVILAPVGCVVSIILLARGAHVLPSLLWPWALAVPAGLGAAFWVTAGHRLEWLSEVWGGRLRRIVRSLEGVGMMRVLIARAPRFPGAWLGIGLYWIADILAFYGALRMFGLNPGALRVVIAYGTGYAATRRSLPLGGAGVTEFLMTYALYWLRMPLAPALAAVLVYRLFNFLLIAAPAVVARRQLAPLLDRGGEASERE
ncbi:MAG TPA: lysylphosphatidylglycerol synthase transmembrane domain-containing protein [Solirubrobacteraceae bacterium]|nr:lysylphosphatidylglycerol synthase transmembrane domain-containing protein [Solirubrobacteraceae bacterium]